MFINSISQFVGLFFKHWVRDDFEGLRLLCAETYYRPEMELISKIVSIALVIYQGIWCINSWNEHTRWVDIKYNGDKWHEMVILPFAVTMISLIIGYIIVINYQLTIMGFEIDPDEDKEKVLMNQIEASVRQWFAYHKYDNMKKDVLVSDDDEVSSTKTKMSRRFRRFSMFSKKTGRS